MQVRNIEFPTNAGRPMRGWLSAPETEAKGLPGVIVIHEATGLVPNIKPVLRRFAQNGYVALAPDLFDKSGNKALCVARTMMTMVRGEGEALHDLESAKSFLRSQPGVNPERLCVAGFCMGGGFALLLALSKGVKASAPYYGMSPVYLSKADQSCPVVASYGGRDALMNPAWPRLKTALAKTSVPHEIKVYPQAGHSFFTEDQPNLLFEFGRIGPLHVGHRPDDAEDSWKRMLAFFAEHV